MQWDLGGGGEVAIIPSTMPCIISWESEVGLINKVMQDVIWYVKSPSVNQLKLQ